MFWFGAYIAVRLMFVNCLQWSWREEGWRRGGVVGGWEGAGFKWKHSAGDSSLLMCSWFLLMCIHWVHSMLHIRPFLRLF